jgi:peptidoglycan/LPS O-acetylase OafA/YrhL
MSRLDLLAMGLVVALVAALRPALSPRAIRWCYTLAGVLLVASGLFFSPSEPAWWGHSVAGVATVCYLLPSVTDRRLLADDGATRIVPAPRRDAMAWATGVATLSYGLYIWQEPVLRALDANGLLPPPSSQWAFPVTAVLMLVATTGVAWLSYHLIETPGHAWLHWSARVERPAAPAGRETPAPGPVAVAGG